MKKRRWTQPLVLFVLLGILVLFERGTTQEHVYDVSTFGAKGDGSTINTKPIQQAIDQCTKEGGGTVYVPPGVFVIGSIRLTDNVNLYVEVGAVLKGSSDLKDYANTTYSSESRSSFLIYAIEAKNISITGRGIINGNDSAFVAWDKLHPECCLDPAFTRQGKNFTNRFPDGPAAIKENSNNRPGALVAFINCENIVMRDITVKNSPNWCVHFACCNGAAINNVTVSNSLLVPNADAFDLSKSKNITLSNCNIVAGDDGIAIATCADGYCKGAVDNIHVSNCTITSRSAGIRLGWSTEDIRNCTFDNLTIKSNRGICINTRHDETIENILFSNIIIDTRLHTGWWGAGEPIHVSEIPLGTMHGLSSEGKKNGVVKNVRFTNMLLTGEAGMVFYGYSKNSLQNLQLNNIRFHFKASKLNASFGGNIDLRPAFDMKYAVFKSDIPAAYFRNVSGLEINRFTVEKDAGLADFHTHAIYCEQFESLKINDFTGEALSASSNYPCIYLTKGKDYFIANSIIPKTSKLLQTSEVTGQQMVTNTVQVQSLSANKN